MSGGQFTNAEIIVPSRGRPREAAMVYESFMDTRTTGRVILLFALDADDPTAPRYPSGKAVRTRCYASRGATQALNLAAEDASKQHRYVGMICDEQRFVTNGWDDALLGALDEMGGGVAFPNDLINPGTMPACALISSAIVRAVGYLALPALRVNYYDNVVHDLGEGVGRLRYLDEVGVQHLSMPHREDNRLAIEEDAYTYAVWKRYQRLRDIEKAKAALARGH